MKKLITTCLILISCLFIQGNENIKNFSQLPDTYDIKLSPNGEMIGVLREINGERMLSIINIDTKELIFNHRYVKKGEIGGFEWLSDERLLMSKITTFATRNSKFPTGELYAVNIDGKKEIILTGRQAKRSSDTAKDDPKKPATLIDLLPEEPNKIMVQFFSSDEFWRLYKVDIFNGEIERYAVPPVRQPYYQFDANGQLIAVAGVNKDTFDLQIYLYNKNIPTEYFVGSSCSGSDVDCIEVVERKAGSISKNPDWTFWKSDSWDSRLELVSYNKDNNTLVTVENLGQDLSGIYRTNLTSGKRKLIYRHDTVDVGSVLTDDEGNVYGATFMDGYPSLVFFKGDSKQKDRLKYVKGLFPNSLISPSNMSDDETRQTFMVSSDVNPGIFYLVDSETETVTPLGKFWGSIEYSKLVPVEPLSFKSRDGATIHGYLTRSAIGNSKDSPTIVHPHGGPEGVRDRWGFDHRSQMLASEGFNVLQINFRGSGGYGLSYQRFISGNWDGVLTDLFDGMEYLHNKGDIDQYNSCIYGGSYGGYAATQGAIMRPDLFKCSVSDVGVYDLVNLFNTGDIQDSRGGKPQLIKRLGADEERHKEMSPHYNAEKLKVPFFMIHGKKDIRAPYEDAVKFSKKLDSIGFEHKKLFIAKEGHGYSDEGVRYESNMELINFFKEHLN
ncbi:MAG: alpha/beta hydrolase family protein [Gammaproteobacteria bacterium]|tara:strand:- start:839 stop:2845 length:2007 start_codon:yes stop_codon:yes gene_type:complete